MESLLVTQVILPENPNNITQLEGCNSSIRASKANGKFQMGPKEGTTQDHTAQVYLQQGGNK